MKYRIIHRIIQDGFGNYFAQVQYHDTEMNEDYWYSICVYGRKKIKECEDDVDFHRKKHSDPKVIKEYDE